MKKIANARGSIELYINTDVMMLSYTLEIVIMGAALPFFLLPPLPDQHLHSLADFTRALLLLARKLAKQFLNKHRELEPLAMYKVALVSQKQQ